MSKYEPIGYVAGVEFNFGGYIPIVHFYQTGRPIEVAWAGNVFGSLADAMTQADRQRKALAEPPSHEEVLSALRNVLHDIRRAGNLMAITHAGSVVAARSLLAKLGEPA